MFGIVPWRREGSRGALARRDPFARMEREFETLFNRFFGELPVTIPEEWAEPRVWGLDVEEKENEVIVRAELPGFEVNEIEVGLVENMLTIEAKHKVEEGKEKPEEFRHVRRSLTLPVGLEVEKIEATYRNGVLELHVPRLPEAAPRKIEIKS